MQTRPSIAARLEMHRQFWRREEQPWPIAAFRLGGDYFVSRFFRAADALLRPGRTITPDMVMVDDFLPDYERMFDHAEELGQDAFWTAEPFIGLPWMEAMLGCRVVAGKDSFVSLSEPWSADDAERLAIRPDDPWLAKYLEFVEKLAILGGGRFTVGQPILRGPADIAGALLGQTEMVMAMMDEPDAMRRFLLKAGEAVAVVFRRQREIVPPFHGGSAIGNFHIFCPGTGAYYQEDISAIMSPQLYCDMLRQGERIKTRL